MKHRGAPSFSPFVVCFKVWTQVLIHLFLMDQNVSVDYDRIHMKKILLKHQEWKS